MKFKLIYIFIWSSFLCFNQVKGQSITPYILNNGGGFSTMMEWSLNESVSIAPFSAGGYFLNTGVLQPLTNIVTGITEYGPTVFGNQILVGPNPTSNILHLKANMNQVGNLSFQLLDAKSSILFTHEAGAIFNSYDRDLQMQAYSDGLFYVRVYFKPNNGTAKVGVYKIIKLSK